MKPRRPRPFDLCDGRIDRDRSRARSQEQAKHIEAASYHAAQARLRRIEKVDLEAHVRGELRAIRDIYTAHTDAAGASSLIASMAVQAIVRAPVARAEAERVFAKAANDGSEG
ncbi:hypothetical protein [Brevundimonas balnearis]|uniref:Uncharacterized protein n=1 Tax=Brevundimonas balnearis TaxID=1572858 RepID=A0ABV6R0X9_9CAUL